MTGEPAKNFHEVGIGPLSKILPVKVLNDTKLFLMSMSKPIYKENN